MTLVAVGAGLLVLAVLDGMFAGFRASCGRTGLIDHRHADRVALGRGLLLVAVLLGPVIVVVLLTVLGSAEPSTYRDAGVAMLAIYAPYGVLVVSALAGYALLDWRHRFLASALILGPFTWIRPLVAVGGAVAALAVTNSVAVGFLAALAVMAVLAVEPLAGRRWYEETSSHPSGSARVRG